MLDKKGPLECESIRGVNFPVSRPDLNIQTRSGLLSAPKHIPYPFCLTGQTKLMHRLFIDRRPRNHEENRTSS